jgi:hypothetical protein
LGFQFTFGALALASDFAFFLYALRLIYWREAAASAFYGYVGTSGVAAGVVVGLMLGSGL